MLLICFAGYLLSKEEGQPGTPEKPLSDLGRVSYHAYWRSVILEYLSEHRDKPFTFDDIAHTTGMHMNDIALTFQLLGFVRYIPNEDNVKLGLCIDWSRVDSHVKKVRSRPRLEIDPECLRWTPLLAPTINPFRSPEEASIDQDTENDAEMKTESEDTATEADDAKAEAKAEEVQEQPMEVTSSGRRRTRPLKYSEATYQTTPAVEGSRKRKRDANRKISESTEDSKNKEETPRRQRSKSVARRSSRVAQEDNEDTRINDTGVKETSATYASDSQESQEDVADVINSTPAVSGGKAKTKRKIAWRGRTKKKAKIHKGTPRTNSPATKKTKINEEQTEMQHYKTDESMELSDQSPDVQTAAASPNSQPEKVEEKKNTDASSEDSSGEADDEMDVEEGEDRRSAASKPTTPRHVEENSTDHHTSDMELDSIHMDSPKSIAEKEQVMDDVTSTDKPEKEVEDSITEVTTENGDSKNESIANDEDKLSDSREEVKSPSLLPPSFDEKDTIIISESDDNNSQSCPLPSPKPNTVAPVQASNENKPKEVEENDSPSKVIPVVSTENAHIVLDPKVQEEVNAIRPPVDLIVPRIHQIETIVVEGESDSGASPHTGVSPKKDQSLFNDRLKHSSPEKCMTDAMYEHRKCEQRKETVIQHQTHDEFKSTEKKSPNKIESILQNFDTQRDIMSNMKKPDPPRSRLDPFAEIDSRNKNQASLIAISKEGDIPFRNELLPTQKDEIIITRNPVEQTLPTYQHPVVNSMTIQQINTAQHSYLNHRASVTKESQSVQTDKPLIKTSEQNRINSMQELSPVISKPTKLEVPHPISSPVINPVIPKVPNVTDINFLPRCQSANAAISMGLERTDLDQSFGSNLQNPLSGSMSIIPSNSQDKNDPNLKPREKSKLREVRVNSAHNKTEKTEKKSSKNENATTPRGTPEPRMLFPEQSTNQNAARKPETSVPTNVINSAPVTSKVETKSVVLDAPKKQDFFKKEKSNTATSKGGSVKHDKTCTTQANSYKTEQADLNKILPKLKYDNELMPKADYTMNQLQNYHSPHAQYQWPPWDPARTWDHNRLFDMKNTVNDKTYLDKLQSFNLPHLDQMQKSPQKLHQKDFHNIPYGHLGGTIYATAAAPLPHFKETKIPSSKAECSQKSDCKPAKQAKTTSSCQTHCESKKQHAGEQMKHMMQRQVKQDDYRQQSPHAMTSPGCKPTYAQNGPCHEKTDIEKKSRKKDESPKDKEEMEAMSPALQSMGVYTPDSTSNSVHSVQYPACELDVSQLGLESPTSIGSDLASPCSMLHLQGGPAPPAPSPQYPHSSIHIPSIMTQPNQPAKHQKINNRNR